MSHNVVNLECDGCGARVATDTKTCPYCHQPIVISTLGSLDGFSPMALKKKASIYNKAIAGDPENDELNMSIAFCYMKMNLYDKAIPCFEKALEENFDNADAYFYAAIALLKGKKAFLSPREVINKVIEYIDAANMIETKGIYYYYLAYIKYDYFERKSLNSAPNYRECIKKALDCGLSDADIETLYNLLGVERPTEL